VINSPGSSVRIEPSQPSAELVLCTFGLYPACLVAGEKLEAIAR
jgi:hypothetical protein